MLGSKASIMRALCANLSSNPWIVRRWHGSILNQHRLSGHRSVSLCLALIENFVFSFHIKNADYYGLGVWPVGRALTFWSLVPQWKESKVSFLDVLRTTGTWWASGTKAPCVHLQQNSLRNATRTERALCAMLDVWNTSSCNGSVVRRNPGDFQHNPFITQMFLDLQWVKSS